MTELEKLLSSHAPATMMSAERIETMNTRPKGIFVACKPPAIFIEVVGRGACRNSEGLRKFGLEKLREGCITFYIDLLHCEGMDSTFLGTFACFGLALRSQGSLVLLNLRGEDRKAFADLGLDLIASIQSEAAPEVRELFPSPSDFTLLPGSDLTKSGSFDALERAILMLECHEDLCRLDQRNEGKFREVKQFLRADILRHSASRNPPDLG